MAEEKKRKSFPLMSVKNWWLLRKRFRTAIPSAVSDSYLATALSMTALSARNNVKPTLRACGLVDGDDKPTDLAVKWRDDKQYSKVCEQIWAKLYPQELRDLAPSGEADRGEVQSWLANHTGAGESGAGKMASFYMMLLEKDPSKEAESAAPGKATKGTPARPLKTRRAATGPVSKAKAQKESDATEGNEGTRSRRGPELHINVQIHIAADSSAEQVEHIFASMARHMKDFL